MSAPSDPRSASGEATRRLARLAISWYSVEPVQVEEILRQVQERQTDGEKDADILQALVEADLITPMQADSLRLGHAPTKADPDSTPIKRRTAPMANGNGVKSFGDEPKQMGPFRILRLLGQGGMGAVFLAFDSKENRQVAVKVLSPEHAPRNILLQRFQLEGKNGALLSHPNIVRSFGTDQDPETGLHYIVLEFVDGPSAHELLDRDGPMQVGDAVHIILDIARALEYAHVNRIIHRDIKPSNILLTTTGVAKLSDMGLAKRRDDTNHLTSTSASIGTPFYMPYEQAMNAKLADERSDIYALGATLYHLITGEVPFSGESSLEIVEKKGLGIYPPARMVIRGLPDTLERILAQMMARDPEDRYQTVSELIVDLERSRLAATIPSFANRSLALQDPIVRKHWTVPIAPTSPDLQLQQHAAAMPSLKEAEELWFLRFEDRQGKLCKSKGSASEILERLRLGKLSPSAEAARTLQGDFKPLRDWPQFQKAAATARTRKKSDQQKGIVRAAPAAPPSEVARRLPIWWWIVASVLGIILVALLFTTLYVFLGA